MKIGQVSDNVVSTSNWSNFWHAFAPRGFVSDSWAFLFFSFGRPIVNVVDVDDIQSDTVNCRINQTILYAVTPIDILFTIGLL